MSDVRFDRLKLLLGEETLDSLSKKRVIVFGVGGVGGYAFESLVRCGISQIAIVDADKVDITNINRQILATEKSIGKDKVDVAEERAKEINPNVVIEKHKCFYLPNEKDGIDLSSFDYVLDCIDTIKAKVSIALEC